MNYVDFRNRIVDKLLQRYGSKTVIYTNVVNTSYDTATRVQKKMENTYTVTGVFLGPKHTFMDGTVVKTADLQFLLDPKDLNFTPRQGDRLTSNSIVYYVHSAHEVKPDGVTCLLWKLDVKAG